MEVDVLLEVDPAEQLHDEERAAVELGRGVGVGDADDVLAADLRRRPRLPLEARDRLGVEARAAEQHLERERLARMHVLDAIHDAHAAATDLAGDAIPPANDGSDVEGVRLLHAPRSALNLPQGLQPSAISSTD